MVFHMALCCGSSNYNDIHANAFILQAAYMLNDQEGLG